MYSSLSIRNSKKSGNLVGVHQKIDRAAIIFLRRHYSSYLQKFPKIEEILRFEGAFGPDGLKKKSPGKDEPEHFIDPENDDGVLMGLIKDHQYNLQAALKKHNRTRASFEAAWLAHALVDGLTPAHHYPYREIVDELMSGKDYKKLFGTEIKGIMRGDDFFDALHNNWLYWGPQGVMTKHIAFEYGIARFIAPLSAKNLCPKHYSAEKLESLDYQKVFYDNLEKVANLKMYDRFLERGWDTQLINELYEILLPACVETVALNWLYALKCAKM